MSLLDKLERWFGRLAIPNLGLWIVAGQFFVLISSLLNRLDLRYFVLVPDLVRHGEWWRLVTFIFYPPPPDFFGGYLLVAFVWYLFYLMTGALESYWGEFRFNVYLLAGYVLTVGAAFLTPHSPTSNLFIGGSVFLAFAWLNPEFEILLFFILPVKIKWLALLTWLGNAFLFVVGNWTIRLLVLASVGNFLLFFASDIVRTARHRRRAAGAAIRAAPRAAAKTEPRHRCYVCGKTDVSHPEMDFRYCSKCAGDQCYCPEHIFHHVHVGPRDEPRAS